MAAAACTLTGELTVEPFAGEHTTTPGDVGAVQLPPLALTTVIDTDFVAVL
jgi:hypothetical protein